MKRKSFLSQGTKNEQMALQITSMADVFVIILVFTLLQLKLSNRWVYYEE